KTPIHFQPGATPAALRSRPPTKDTFGLAPRKPMRPAFSANDLFAQRSAALPLARNDQAPLALNTQIRYGLGTGRFLPSEFGCRGAARFLELAKITAVNPRRLWPNEKKGYHDERHICSTN